MSRAVGAHAHGGGTGSRGQHRETSRCNAALRTASAKAKRGLGAELPCRAVLFGTLSLHINKSLNEPQGRGDLG